MTVSSTATVMVVEDEAMVALALASILQTFGFNVIGPCASAEAALAAASAQRPDLVLMDINLRGGIDGIEAARRLSDAYGVQVVFVTGQGDPKTRERADQIGHAGYLVKPYRPAQLEKTIRAALSAHPR